MNLTSDFFDTFKDYYIYDIQTNDNTQNEQQITQISALSLKYILYLSEIVKRIDKKLEDIKEKKYTLEIFGKEIKILDILDEITKSKIEILDPTNYNQDKVLSLYNISFLLIDISRVLFSGKSKIGKIENLNSIYLTPFLDLDKTFYQQSLKFLNNSFVMSSYRFNFTTQTMNIKDFDFFRILILKIPTLTITLLDSYNKKTPKDFLFEDSIIQEKYLNTNENEEIEVSLFTSDPLKASYKGHLLNIFEFLKKLVLSLVVKEKETGNILENSQITDGWVLRNVLLNNSLFDELNTYLETVKIIELVMILNMSLSAPFLFKRNNKMEYYKYTTNPDEVSKIANIINNPRDPDGIKNTIKLFSSYGINIGIYDLQKEYEIQIEKKRKYKMSKLTQDKYESLMFQSLFIYMLDMRFKNDYILSDLEDIKKFVNSMYQICFITGSTSFATYNYILIMLENIKNKLIK